MLDSIIYYFIEKRTDRKIKNYFIFEKASGSAAGAHAIKYCNPKHQKFVINDCKTTSNA